MEIEQIDELKEVLKKDVQHRYVGVTDDLFKMDQIFDVANPEFHGYTNNWRVIRPYLFKKWKNNFPTLYSKRHHEIFYESGYIDNFHPLNIPNVKTIFRNKFYQKYPFLDGFTRKGMLVAGGALQVLLCNDKREFDFSDVVVDLDIFFYGITQEKAIQYISELETHIGKEYITDYVKNQNALTLVLDHVKLQKDGILDVEYEHHQRYKTRSGTPPLQIQFIFCLHNSISEVLHGFDLASSCVGFDLDTQEFYFTSLSKFAYKYILNIVDVRRISPSFEHRLHKYFERGFGIILPNFKFTAQEKKILLPDIISHRNTNEILININLPQIRFGIVNENLYIFPKNCSNCQINLHAVQKGLKFCGVCGAPYPITSINNGMNVRFINKSGEELSYGKWLVSTSDYGVDEDVDIEQHLTIDKNLHQDYVDKASLKLWSKNIINRSIINLIFNKFDQIILINKTLDNCLHNNLQIIKDYLKNEKNIIDKSTKNFLNDVEIILDDQGTPIKFKSSRQIRRFALKKLKDYQKYITNDKHNKFKTKHNGAMLNSSFKKLSMEDWEWYGPDHYKPTYANVPLIIDAINGHEQAIELLTKFYGIPKLTNKKQRRKYRPYQLYFPLLRDFLFLVDSQISCCLSHNIGE